MSTLQEINRDIQDVSKKLVKAESDDSSTDQDDEEDQKNEDSLEPREDEKFKWDERRIRKRFSHFLDDYSKFIVLLANEASSSK